MSLEERLAEELDAYQWDALDFFKPEIQHARISIQNLDDRDKRIVLSALEDDHLHHLFCGQYYYPGMEIPLFRAVVALQKTNKTSPKVSTLRERYFLSSLHSQYHYSKKEVPFWSVNKLLRAVKTLDPESTAQLHFAERLLEIPLAWYNIHTQPLMLITCLHDSQTTAIRLLDTFFDYGRRYMDDRLARVMESLSLIEEIPAEVESQLKKYLDVHHSGNKAQKRNLGFLVLTLLDYRLEKGVEYYHYFKNGGEQEKWDVILNERCDVKDIKYLLGALATSEYPVSEWTSFIQAVQIGRKRVLKKKNSGGWHALQTGSSVTGCVTLEELFEFLSFEIKEYSKVKMLGHGASGSTYLVHSDQLQKRFAAKIIDPQLVNPKEAVLLARLEGKDLENIVQMYHTSRKISTVNGEKRYTLIMEYVEGKTLDELMRDGKMPFKDAVSYGAQIINAIRGLRAHHITHRDIRPKNIIVKPDGNLKILDFGIATDEQEAEQKGNRRYGSPTILKTADDLFSFGLIWYEMTTGEHLVVLREDGQGSETHAQRVAELKSQMYEDGKLKEEWRRKIEEKYAPFNDEVHELLFRKDRPISIFFPDDPMVRIDNQTVRNNMKWLVISALEGTGDITQYMQAFSWLGAGKYFLTREELLSQVKELEGRVQELEQDLPGIPRLYSIKPLQEGEGELPNPIGEVLED